MAASCRAAPSGPAARSRAGLLLIALVAAGASTAFTGLRSSPAIRGGVATRAAAGEAVRAKPINVLVKMEEGNTGITVEVARYAKASDVNTVSAMLPLGLLITENNGCFVVEDIRAGGAIALGEADVQVGDIVHAVSTSAASGDKGMIPVSAFTTVEQMSEAIIGNEDGKVFLVIERNIEGGGGANPIGWMFDVSRQF